MSSNILKYSTVDELRFAINSYNSFMSEIPDEFIVLEEHLNGLTNVEFCKAFKALRNIVVQIYINFEKNPEKIGLMGYIKKTGEEKIQRSQNISSIKKILYTIGLVSELRNNVLILDMKEFANSYSTFYSSNSIALSDNIKSIGVEEFNKFYLKKHIPAILTFLSSFGFKIEGFMEGKNFSELKQLKVSFPSMPHVSNVMKAFSQLRISRISFGFDYTKFNFKVRGLNPPPLGGIRFQPL